MIECAVLLHGMKMGIGIEIKEFDVMKGWDIFDIYLLALNSLVSSSRLITCTLLLYSSMKLPNASRNRLSGRTLQFIEYSGHGARYL